MKWHSLLKDKRHSVLENALIKRQNFSIFEMIVAKTVFF